MLRKMAVLAILMVLVLGGGSVDARRNQDESLLATVGAALCPEMNVPPGGTANLASCVPGEGITITGSVSDGESLGSCVTSGTVTTSYNGSFATCQLTIPAGLADETTLQFSQDPGTIPGGYTATDPRSSTVGTFRERPDFSVVFYNSAVSGSEPGAPVEPTETSVTSSGSAETPPATGIAIADREPTGTATGATVTASPVVGGSEAAVFSGTCDTEQYAGPVADLANLISPEGDRTGADNASAVETSFSTVDLSLDALTGDDHAIVIFNEDNQDVALACGAIGGFVAKDGSLAIGLRAQGDSRFSGIAYLSPSGDGTDVSIFLAEDLAGK